MPRSELSLGLEWLRDRLDPDKRFVDLGARLQVWRCRCGVQHVPPATDEKSLAAHLERLRSVKHEKYPAEILPRLYGGKYDRLTRQYVGRPDEKNVHLLPCHLGQVPVLTSEERFFRELVLGAPGSGKTTLLCLLAALQALQYPNTTGGLVAPTGDRRQIIWDGLLEIAQPLGWIEDVTYTKKQIRWINGVVVDVLAAKAPSAQVGNPLQGRSWDWCGADESHAISDEAHREIAARGRRAGKRYRIWESATNNQNPAFRVRLEELKKSPQARIFRVSGHQNDFLDPEWWDRLKGDMSEREFRQFVLAEDVPPEMLVYPEFQFDKHVQVRPDLQGDITAGIVAQRYGRHGVKYIVAHDPGVMVNASIFYKVFRGPNGSEDRVWWAVNEITSYRTTSDIHARMILERYESAELLVICDPHFNTKDTDKSDFHLLTGEGLNVIPAAPKAIKKEHRIAMMRSLLRDERFFIEKEKGGKPRCKKLVESFTTMQRNDWGEAERDRKDRRDMSHWTAAAGYGVFPWEQIRGNARVEFVRGR